ncbi:hypothetical protein ARMSODRAFT_1001550 [Armillaria solidipes]|uniref:Uncharacterized protein n=1 Tax=Armillaria solidipes TaxID=1076256 RepID=A0A2H3BWU5_9AGAR|nr:hypothetical protein ARMSODRAFT_1001550 [Armillaria solidipes]
MTPMFEKMGPVDSELQNPQELPVSKLVNGDAGFRIPQGTDPLSVNMNLLRSPSDNLFTFALNKLSIAQTCALNAVLLKNVRRDGAITFLGKERMLRTTHSFFNDQTNKYDRQKFISLMRHLSVIPTTTVQALSSYDPVDADLYAALMKILLYEKLFLSHYDRALSIFRPKCQTHFGGDVYKAIGGSVTLESSLSEEVSSQVFQGLDWFILDELCVRLAYDISDVLGQVGKEVVLVAFLDWVIDESAHVLDKIPGVTMQAVLIQIL